MRYFFIVSLLVGFGATAAAAAQLPAKKVLDELELRFPYVQTVSNNNCNVAVSGCVVTFPQAFSRRTMITHVSCSTTAPPPSTGGYASVTSSSSSLQDNMHWTADGIVNEQANLPFSSGDTVSVNFFFSAHGNGTFAISCGIVGYTIPG